MVQLLQLPAPMVQLLLRPAQVVQLLQLPAPMVQLLQRPAPVVPLLQLPAPMVKPVHRTRIGSQVTTATATRQQLPAPAL